MLLDTRVATPPASGISLNENSLYILKKRYLKKNIEGRVTETPEEMFDRVARTVASAELIYNPEADVKVFENEFYRLMSSLEFLPNSPTLLNAGRQPGQLSACFVLPVDDSRETISKLVENAILVHRNGGGTGFCFSKLGPGGYRVGHCGKAVAGPIAFLKALSDATYAIMQGGIRRGCNMAALDVSHPDIMNFITAKNDPDVLTNFYISIVVTNDFMEAVKTGTGYNLINPCTGVIAGRLSARSVFNKIVEQTWKTGDPGIVFIEPIEQDNPTPQLGKLESVCGCGEQSLLPYESANLGSINLARMLVNRNGFTEIDYPKLIRTVKTSVRFLDNVIDVNQFPLPEIEEATRKTRKIGLGVMGFADMLIQLNIPYDSEEALETASEIMKLIKQEAYIASIGLAEERGVFPAYNGSIYDVEGGPLLRNASLITIAPTGTLSLIDGCSSGIEPLFALAFVRNILGGDRLLEVNPYFEAMAREKGFYSDNLMKRIASGTRLHTIENVPDEVKRLFVTSLDIKNEWHVSMQSAFQRYTDGAISKTVNLPQKATLEDVARTYMMAYEAGLKGITIYRDGSRASQPFCSNGSGLELMCRRLQQGYLNGYESNQY